MNSLGTATDRTRCAGRSRIRQGDKSGVGIVDLNTGQWQQYEMGNM